MNIVLYTHPIFLGLQSQQHFARMLLDAYRQRGHSVELRQPAESIRKLAIGAAAKWAGYVDQYVIFPRQMRAAMKADAPQTLYVFCDQALGPWVPVASARPHVVHCHDLLALRSSLGEFPENAVSSTGRIYQRYIRAGFAHARHFISISEKSRSDLLKFGRVDPVTSEVVYNGLNHPYRRLAADESHHRLRRAGLLVPQGGFVLHVGGGQWYKNCAGVLRIYAAYAVRCEAEGSRPSELWMLSPAPNSAQRAIIDSLPKSAHVRYLAGLESGVLEALYSTAGALLFPSLAEGFGWPIAEALACGCPVITTDEAPMNEVGGSHAHYLPRLKSSDDVLQWAMRAAELLASLLDAAPAEGEARALAGIEWARRYDPDVAIDSYLRVYEAVLAHAHRSTSKAINS